MEKLLQWSIAQQSGDREAMERIGQPDPEALGKLFGTGPDEPTLMKQSIEVVEHPEATSENKQIALENFEMLIENLDNANNIENLKLWPSIIKLLNDDVDDSDLKVLACSIIGIAVQNNPISQENFNSHETGLEKLIKIANNNSNKSLQLKAIFAIASFIRNFKPGYTRFEQLNGWEIINNNMSSNDNKLLVRVLSLISAILSNEFNQELLQQQNLIHLLCSILQDKDANSNIIDKSLSIIADLHRNNYQFSTGEKSSIAEGIKQVEHLGDQLNEDNITDAKKALA